MSAERIERTGQSPEPTEAMPLTDVPPRRSRSDGRSVPDLVRELSHEGADLVRHEVALAKAEMNEKIDSLQRNMVAIAIGGAFMIAALLYGLWAVNSGVTLILAQFMDAGTAIWLAPLLLGVALGLIGWGMMRAAKESMSREGLTPRETKKTLEDDARWARSKAREVQQEVKHG